MAYVWDMLTVSWVYALIMLGTYAWCQLGICENMHGVGFAHAWHICGVSLVYACGVLGISLVDAWSTLGVCFAYPWN